MYQHSTNCNLDRWKTSTHPTIRGLWSFVRLYFSQFNWPFIIKFLETMIYYWRGSWLKEVKTWCPPYIVFWTSILILGHWIRENPFPIGCLIPRKLNQVYCKLSTQQHPQGRTRQMQWVARITLGDRRKELQPGQWSDKRNVNMHKDWRCSKHLKRDPPYLSRK